MLEYAHDGASCSVTGGYFSRDADTPKLAARYIYGDFCTGALHAAVLEGGRVTPASKNVSLDLTVPRLTGFGEDAKGHLHITSRSDGSRPGAVYLLRAAR